MQFKKRSLFVRQLAVCNTFCSVAPGRGVYLRIPLWNPTIMTQIVLNHLYRDNIVIHNSVFF